MEPEAPTSLAWLFERNDALVREAFRRGDFDYVEGVGEACEADFFRAITQKKVLEKLADTYPSPCQKHDVPLWVYLASDISMRFHGVHHFHAFLYVVRSGGLVQAFGPWMGHKVTHPQTGDVSLRCEGFNDKNDYDRQTPCGQDYLRKMARRTDAALLQAWFNRDVMGIFKQHHALDREGIFIGDATYLFVPDNPNYEGSARLLFDEHNHPVDSRQLTVQERAGCVRRRCYKLVSLIHTNRAGEFFLYAGLKVTSGQDPATAPQSGTPAGSRSGSLSFFPPLGEARCRPDRSDFSAEGYCFPYSSDSPAEHAKTNPKSPLPAKICPLDRERAVRWHSIGEELSPTV